MTAAIVIGCHGQQFLLSVLLSRSRNFRLLSLTQELVTPNQFGWLSLQLLKSSGRATPEAMVKSVWEETVAHNPRKHSSIC
jgi:hypothetical protein